MRTGVCTDAMVQILKGVEFLHSNNLVHRDLKSSNIMMSIRGRIKLSTHLSLCFLYFFLYLALHHIRCRDSRGTVDFGLCCDVRMCRKGKMAGSPYWMPPEMVRRRKHSFPVLFLLSTFLCNIFFG